MPFASTSKSIKELLAHVDSNELILPEIQREFVWPRKAVKLLFDSLYRNLPIGHMLVWKTHIDVHGRVLTRKRGRRVMHDNFYGYLLDGQQRLTAVSFVRDGHDDYRLLFNLWPEKGEEEGDDQPFWWSARWAEDDPWMIPVSEVLNEDFGALRYLDHLRKDDGFKPGYDQVAHDRILELRKILDHRVSITEFESDKYEDATELFIRFNSTGKKLNKADLAVAELAVKVPGLGSEDIGRAMAHWRPGYRFTRPFLVQSLVAVRTGRMNWKKAREIWEDSSAAEIRGAWQQTERGLGETMKLLTGTVRWDSSTWVPSFNTLIPLIVVFSAPGKLSAPDRELARRWLLLASVHSYFSGKMWAQLDRVIRRLDGKPSVKRLWRIGERSLRKVRPDDFETRRVNGPAMALYISMLRTGNAVDWKEQTPLDGTVVGRNAKLQVHHVFPRALLRRFEFAASDIDTFANYALVSADTNLNLGTEEPATYLERESIRRKDLDDQCIPLDKAMWRASRYKEFLGERRKLLAERANAFLFG